MRIIVCLFDVLIVYGLNGLPKYIRELVPSELGRCLDGSPPVIYVSIADVPTSNWLIRFEGGGWCSSDQDCLERASTRLGSSDFDYDPENVVKSVSMFYVRDSEYNPLFHNFNYAHLHYCDGGSWSGTLAEPVVVNGKSIYYSGSYILNDTLLFLTDKYDLGKKAKYSDPDPQIVVSGASAGGLAAIFYSDRVQKLYPTATVSCIPDSGFFPRETCTVIDDSNYGDVEVLFKDGEYTKMMKWVYERMGAEKGVNQNCIAAYKKGEGWDEGGADFAYHEEDNEGADSSDDGNSDRDSDDNGDSADGESDEEKKIMEEIIAEEEMDESWHCIFAEYSLRYQQVPTFLLQSKYDWWVLDHAMCEDKDESEVKSIHDFSHRFLKRMMDSIGIDGVLSSMHRYFKDEDSETGDKKEEEEGEEKPEANDSNTSDKSATRIAPRGGEVLPFSYTPHGAFVDVCDRHVEIYDEQLRWFPTLWDHVHYELEENAMEVLWKKKEARVAEAKGGGDQREVEEEEEEEEWEGLGEDIADSDSGDSGSSSTENEGDNINTETNTDADSGDADSGDSDSGDVEALPERSSDLHELTDYGAYLPLHGGKKKTAAYLTMADAVYHWYHRSVLRNHADRALAVQELGKEFVSNGDEEYGLPGAILGYLYAYIQPGKYLCKKCCEWGTES